MFAWFLQWHPFQKVAPVAPSLLTNKELCKYSTKVYPNSFVHLRSIPVIGNGKCDRNQLVLLLFTSISCQKDHLVSCHECLQKRQWKEINHMDLFSCPRSGIVLSHTHKKYSSHTLHTLQKCWWYNNNSPQEIVSAGEAVNTLLTHCILQWIAHYFWIRLENQCSKLKLESPYDSVFAKRVLTDWEILGK